MLKEIYYAALETIEFYFSYKTINRLLFPKISSNGLSNKEYRYNWLEQPVFDIRIRIGFFKYVYLYLNKTEIGLSRYFQNDKQFRPQTFQAHYVRTGINDDQHRFLYDELVNKYGVG